MLPSWAFLAAALPVVTLAHSVSIDQDIQTEIDQQRLEELERKWGTDVDLPFHTYAHRLWLTDL